MSEFELDARRLLCPMPVIRTQDRVNELQAGDILKVTCTDPGAQHDIPAWCRVCGHKVINVESIGNEIVIHIEVMPH